MRFKSVWDRMIDFCHLEERIKKMVDTHPHMMIVPVILVLIGIEWILYRVDKFQDALGRRYYGNHEA